jgi:hypothetical protein
MAELVDASDSKSGVRKDVQVRFLFWAQMKKETESGERLQTLSLSVSVFFIP